MLPSSHEKPARAGTAMQEGAGTRYKTAASSLALQLPAWLRLAPTSAANGFKPEEHLSELPE